MLDRAQGMGADGEPDALFERFALQRHAAKIRQETALGSALGMAHIVAGEHGFAGELATTGHDPLSFSANGAEPGLALGLSGAPMRPAADIYGAGGFGSRRRHQLAPS